MKSVLLVGILGVYNYGCEAIIRGTVEILRRINPSVRIAYASYDYENDIKRLKDLGIDIIHRPEKFKRWTLQNILWKLNSIFHLPFVRPYDTTNWIKGFDTVLSIGGDMYTLGSDGNYKTDLPLFFEECQRKGLKYILWGASVGPFDRTPAAVDFYTKHLANADLIVAREETTIAYLSSIGVVDNVVFAPDPAFFVPDPQLNITKKDDGRLRIGINLSPLSAAHTYENAEKAIEKQADTITKLYENYGYDFVFLPHVVSPRIWEDDLAYLKRIYDKLPAIVQEHTQIIESNPGFVGLKKIIHGLDFVIAARMHCAINAICCNIPVLFLSYSAKAKGMAKLIYGDDERVIPINQFEDIYLIHNVIESSLPDTKLKHLQSFDFSTIL